MKVDRFNDLLVDFRSKHHKIDYFTQEEIFQYMRMSFHIGFDSGNINKHGNKEILRSDGKRYSSISEAARKNKTRKQNISRAANKNKIAVGYKWKFI